MEARIDPGYRHMARQIFQGDLGLAPILADYVEEHLLRPVEADLLRRFRSLRRPAAELEAEKVKLRDQIARQDFSHPFLSPLLESDEMVQPEWNATLCTYLRGAGALEQPSPVQPVVEYPWCATLAVSSYNRIHTNRVEGVTELYRYTRRRRPQNGFLIAVFYVPHLEANLLVNVWKVFQALRYTRTVLCEDSFFRRIMPPELLPEFRTFERVGKAVGNTTRLDQVDFPDDPPVAGGITRAGLAAAFALAPLTPAPPEF